MSKKKRPIQGEPKRKHSGLKIVLAVIAVLAAVAAVAAYTQRDYIKAYLTARSLSKEEVQNLQEEADDGQDEALRKLGIPFEPISEQDKQAIRGGELTEEEMLARLFELQAQADRKQSGDEKAAQQPGQEAQSGDTRLEELITHVYYLREVYSAQLDGLYEQAIEKYKALPEQERTTKEKIKIALSLNGRARALESECDAEIESTLLQLKQTLTDTGGDLSAVDDIRSAYEAQKEARRAYYLSLLV